MPSYPHIERYRADLQRFLEFGGSDNEQSIRRAFAVCLDSYCRDHREKLALVDELDAGGGSRVTGTGIRPDGTVKDSLRMARGYWEAKDTHDDLDAEIQAKFNRGYPRDNILFEDSATAVLFQNGNEAMRVDMSRPGENCTASSAAFSTTSCLKSGSSARPASSSRPTCPPSSRACARPSPTPRPATPTTRTPPPSS